MRSAATSPRFLRSGVSAGRRACPTARASSADGDSRWLAIRRSRLAIDPERYAGFFEAHIEQGDTLETEQLRIGVVTAIVAIWQYGFTVTGEQNHAAVSVLRSRFQRARKLVNHRRVESVPLLRTVERQRNYSDTGFHP